MNEKNFNWLNVIKFAGAYVACAIGSGFATGQEILQFFTSYGIYSVIGAVVTMVLFAWIGGLIMEHGYEMKLNIASWATKYYFGQKAGIFFEIIFQIFLFGVFVIMIAGSGATLAEYYGLGPMVGRVGMILLSLFTVVLGLSKITDILGSLGTVIIVMSIGIGLISAVQGFDNLSAASEAVISMDMVRASGNWFLSSVLYPGFNVIVVFFFLIGIGASAGNKKEAFCGGVLGGVFLGLAILCLSTGLLVNITEVAAKEVPTLVLADKISPILGVIFSIIIICGIYTTAVPLLWSVSSALAAEKTKKFVLITVVLSVAALILGMTDFRTLVNTIYPYSGYVGIVLMVIIAYRAYCDKRTRSEVGNEINAMTQEKSNT